MKPTENGHVWVAGPKGPAQYCEVCSMPNEPEHLGISCYHWKERTAAWKLKVRQIEKHKNYWSDYWQIIAVLQLWERRKESLGASRYSRRGSRRRKTEQHDKETSQ